MRVEDLLVYGKTYCHSDHVKLLLADLLNLNPLELLNHLEDIVEDEKIDLFKKEIKSLKEGKPLQYVIGNVNFYGNRFLVNENVLIPRFETEELVENDFYSLWLDDTMSYSCGYFKNENDSLYDAQMNKIHHLLKKLNLKEGQSLLDIGCGSGVIGLTLKQKYPTSEVDLLDISEKAIEVAQQNAKNLNLDVNFIKSDVFENVDKKYDLIISNPPYIKDEEEIEDIVKNNEPNIALYAGKDGLDVYKKILKEVKYYMNDPCLIAFEIGMTQKEDLINLTNKYLDNVIIETKKDLSDKDRMIFILKK